MLKFPKVVCIDSAPRAELYVNGEKSRALFLTFCTVAICMKIKNTDHSDKLRYLQFLLLINVVFKYDH